MVSNFDDEPGPPETAANSAPLSPGFERSYRALPSLQSLSRKNGVTFQRQLHLAVITIAMGVIDVEDRGLLGLLLSSITVTAALGVTLQVEGTAGIVLAAAIVATTVGCIMLLRKSSLEIEGMDRYAKRFDAAEREHLCDREGHWLEADRLGPASFKPHEGRVLQAEGSTVQSLTMKAEELLDGFGTDVLDACVHSPRCMSKKPSIKCDKRAREKVRIEYDNDARYLKDILRGSVICDTMDQLCACFTALQSLESITVMQVRIA